MPAEICESVYMEMGIKTEPVMRLHNSDFITGSVVCCKWTMDFPVNNIRKIRTVIFLTENVMHAEVFPLGLRLPVHLHGLEFVIVSRYSS